MDAKKWIIFRMFLITSIWIAYIVGVIAFVITMELLGAMLSFLLFFPIIILTGFIVMWEPIMSVMLKHSTESLEKRKRERIDHVLRDLSDDDLLTLRRRLQDGSIDDDVLYERMIGDDGELMEHS